jgi:cob(I)alamin adenosyltransferase
VSDSDLDAQLNQNQNDLIEVGAELGTTEDRKQKGTMPLIEEPQVEALERAIDKYEQGPPALTSFVLPGGSEGAARFHLARCVCRRAERSLVALGAQESLRGELFRYVNRLSDLLFVLARYANHMAGVEDIPWKGQGG